MIIGYSRVLAVACGPWTPAELGADVIAWYDAMDASNFSLSGSTVTQWNDISGNGWHLTSESGKQPTRETVADFGSANAVKFDGSDDYLKSSNSFVVGSGGGPLTICSIYRTGSTIDDLEQLFDGRQSGGFAIALFHKWSGASDKPTIFHGSSVARHNTVLSTSTSYIDIADTTVGAAKAYLNGNFPTPTSVDAGGAGQAFIKDGFGLGGPAFASGLTTFGGHIGEFIIVDRILTYTEQKKMEGYLAHRWGRTADLPGGHPYKIDPPTECDESPPVFSAFSLQGAIGTKDASQTLGAGDTALTWPTESRDTDAIHDTGSNTSRMTIPASLNGKLVIISAQVRQDHTSSPGSGGKLTIRKNGSESYDGFGQWDTQGMFSNVLFHYVSTHPIRVATGDYFEAFLHSTEGALSAAPTTGIPRLEIWVVAP
jgi:hypothetical protein